jgi:CheY-like chemotaxis protein
MTKVLVIDDEPAVRKIICDNLKLSGFDVVSAADGEEGLALIDPAHPPRVVITDLIMPRKGGLEVIAEIKKSHPSIKTIAISGGGRIEAANDLLEKARETGADAALAKPLDLDLLERTLEGLLG